jgi:hypothetical protein
MAKAMKRSMKARKSAMKSRRRKAMKKRSAMKRRAMKKRVSKVGRKWMVLKGSRVRTTGGLKATDLCKNKHGKVVSKKMSAKGKKMAWPQAVVKARKALGVKGFQAIGGKSAKGQALLRKVRSFYKK